VLGLSTGAQRLEGAGNETTLFLPLLCSRSRHRQSSQSRWGAVRFSTLEVLMKMVSTCQTTYQTTYLACPVIGAGVLFIFRF
jgi:hypothetical protein